MNWLDVYLGKFKCYRKHTKKKWYKHSFTVDALQLSPNLSGYFWATYGEINRYSVVDKIENYEE